MAQINAYLNFNGLAREALTFYKECLGGELVMQKIAESPMAAQMPSEMGIRILHGVLSNETMVLMASDCMGDSVKNGNNIMLCLNCRSDEEINSIFHTLSEEGKINEPLQQSFWGATFGNLTDKFGITWILNYKK